MAINKVILLGNLGKDPELRMSQQQTPICRFSLATGERKKDQSGQWVEHTEWHNIVVFGKSAENCSKYLKKGRQVFIEGRIRTNKWQDKEGKDRYTTEILGDNVQFIGGARGGDHEVEVSNGHQGEEVLAGLSSADNIPRGKPQMAVNMDEPASFDDDDIPF